MKITLTWIPAAGTQPTSFVLADSPASVPLTNFRINGARNIQEAEFFRANGRQFYDRGNRKTVVTFDTTRSFPDQVSAESFALLHETQFPGQFSVTFTAGRSGAGAAANRYLTNAVVESAGSSLMGCTTKHSYRIAGGVMGTTTN